MNGMNHAAKRTVLLVSVTLFFLLSAFGADHTVLVEGVSSTTCGHCSKASEAMGTILDSGAYDLCYVAFIYNKNEYVYPRATELGVTGIPHYVFDGGYQVKIGSGSLPDAYITCIDACLEREPADVALDASVTWSGDIFLGITLDVRVTVTNNETTSYTGLLRVHVVEKTSRWMDTYGNPFHNAMVGDYAINEEITVAGGESSEITAAWKSAPYGINDIEQDNIEVIAAVYDNSSGVGDEAISVDPQSGGIGPDTPAQPQGGVELFAGRDYTFTTGVTHPEGGAMQLLWDFGDDSPAVWSDPVNSGETADATHTWLNPGTFSVKVQAKDAAENLSAWSEPLEVTVALWGEVNGDEAVNIADAVFLLSYLFADGAPPALLWTADLNEDASVNIADVVTILTYLFGG